MFEFVTLSRPVEAAGALALLWILESIFPMFERREHRVRHGLTNVALGVANAVIVSLVFAAATLWVTEASRERSIGLLHLLSGPPLLRVGLALVLFDLWQYAWHRLNHRVPFLWRFHAVHHADRDLDASSALRFHTGEIVLSSAARLAVLPVLGLTVQHLLVYELVLLPIILFHHSNLRLPESVDRRLRWLIVTPWMHWVHHSDYRPETDSNYASVFSFWDRLFGSFRLRRDPTGLDLGLENVTRREWATLSGMLAMPFRRSRPRPREREDA